MDRCKKYLSTVAGLLTVVTVLNVTQVGQVGAQATKDRDVVIVNTPAEPVPTTVQTLPPITGSVSLTNTPTVNLQPGVTVGLSSSNTTVRIGGVVGISDVDNPANQPVVVLVATTFPSGFFVFDQNGCIFVGGTCIAGTVPPGKRLVIESAGADVRLPPGARALRL